MKYGLPDKKTLGPCPKLWTLLCREGSQSEGRVEYTHIMKAGVGVVLRTTIELRSPKSPSSLAVSTVYVPTPFEDFFPDSRRG